MSGNKKGITFDQAYVLNQRLFPKIKKGDYLKISAFDGSWYAKVTFVDHALKMIKLRTEECFNMWAGLQQWNELSRYYLIKKISVLEGLLEVGQ